MEDQNSLSVMRRISVMHPLVMVLIPERCRDAVVALWRVDEECARSLRVTADPSLQTIRLIWWRDQLEGLATQTVRPINPTLAGIAQHLSLAQIDTLSALPDFWADLAELDLSDEAGLAAFSAVRGTLVYRMTAALCGVDLESADGALNASGSQWAMIDLANNLSDLACAEMLRSRALGSKMPKLPSSLKPLSALTALARSRAQSQGKIRPFREQFLLLRYGIVS